MAPHCHAPRRSQQGGARSPFLRPGVRGTARGSRPPPSRVPGERGSPQTLGGATAVLPRGSESRAGGRDPVALSRSVPSAIVAGRPRASSAGQLACALAEGRERRGTRVRRVFPSHVGEGGCGHAGPASPRGPGPFRSTMLSVSPRCAQAEDTEGEGRGLHPLSLSQGAARCHRRHAPAASPGPGCGGGIRQRGLGSVHRAVNAGGNGAFVAEEAGVEWPLAVPGTSLDQQRKCPLSVPFSS